MSKSKCKARIPHGPSAGKSQQQIERLTRLGLLPSLAELAEQVRELGDQLDGGIYDDLWKHNQQDLADELAGVAMELDRIAKEIEAA